MKKIWIMALAMTVGVAISASAQNWVWIGGAGPTGWTDVDGDGVSTAWSGGAGGIYPGQATTQGVMDALNGVAAHITLDHVLENALSNHNNIGLGAAGNILLEVQTGGSMSINDPWVGRNQGAGHIDVNGGAVVTPGLLRIASGNTDPGTRGWLTVRNGGTVTTGGSLLLGRNVEHTGIVTILDGTVRVNGTEIRRDDITPELDAPNIYITLNHHEAIFRWAGDKVAAMNTLIGNGLLRTGGIYEFVEEGPQFFSDLGYTELRVIPEPGTIALLGVAGLVLLIRRRRSVK